MWKAARPSTTIALMSQRDRRSSDGARRLLAPFKNAEYRMLVAALMAAVVAAGTVAMTAFGVVATLATGVYTVFFAGLQYLGVRRLPA